MEKNMAIYDQINDQLKEAMKAGDKDRVRGLRSIRAAFIEAVKSDGRTTLPDDEAVGILRRLAKLRQESLDSYTSAGRGDLAAEERADLAVIEVFLPQLADEGTLRGWVDEAIAAVGASSAKDMGKVMGALGAAHKGAYDGRAAQAIVKEKLGG
jgi:uncharacterized protein YqeY